MILQIISGDKVIKELIEQPFYDGEKYHLSRLAQCGKKYAYERVRDTYAPHKDIFDIGLAFENYILQAVSNKYPGVQHNYPCELEMHGVGGEVINFQGHIDIWVPGENIAIEVKYSESRGDYYESYVRQLRAYGAALKQAGINARLILVMYKNKTIKEYELHQAGDEDLEALYGQLKAFQNKRYVKGIESPLCSICPLYQFCNAESMQDYGLPIYLRS